ncbi:MAG: isochorismate synthase [Candidatus Hydrogenedentota bacterium]
MTKLYSHSETIEPRLAKDALASVVQQVLESVVPGEREFPRALRVEFPIEHVDALSWLHAQRTSPRMYWADRESEFDVAGVGAADVIAADTDTDFEPLIAQLRATVSSTHPDLRYYGGARFSQGTAKSDPWRPFGACSFVLPRFELLNRGTQSYLVCNALLHDAGGVEAELREIFEAIELLRFPDAASLLPLPRIVKRVDRPDATGWAQMVTEVLRSITGGSVQKVVLARETTFTFDAALDPISILTRLVPRSPESYRFFFEPEPGVAFIGATPERLVKRDRRYVQSEAVAGTRPRGSNPQDDDRLGSELMNSDKDRREHKVVLDTIQSVFNDLCHAVHVAPEVSLLKLRRCQHLFCPVEGILSDNASGSKILRALHPTPAVGGYPTARALDVIESLEPFDRGWYAGPIGWVGNKASEFAVAIRSGLVHGNTLSLYSGAGIVEGSTPADEWAEIENKMSNFLSVLTGDVD